MKNIFALMLFTMYATSAYAGAHPYFYYHRHYIGLYVKGSVGTHSIKSNMPNKDAESFVAPSLGLGYKFNRYYRGEASFFSHGQTNEVSPMRFSSLGLNLYKDFPTTTIFTPYITIGVGNMQTSSTQINNNLASNNTGYLSMGAGVRAAIIMKEVDMELGYKYTHYRQNKFEGHHQGALSIIYHF